MGMYFAALIKAMIMVTASFFVLITVTKTDSKNLKQFGRILAVTLWILAAAVYIQTVYCSINARNCRGLGYKMHYLK